MDIGEIIAARSALVRSESKIVIKEAEAPGRLLEAMQQIALSSAPVGTEVSFYRPPQGRLQFDGVLSPSGPSGEMKGMQITTNPLIPRKVDQMVEDRDAAAAAAVGELYTCGIGTDHISRMLSLGLLGKKRKLVPTRWSITASDDMIGKLLKETVLDGPQVNDYYLFSGEDLGNHFEILLLPRPFSFELVEIWMARSVWAEEGFIGGDREDAQAQKAVQLTGGRLLRGASGRPGAPGRAGPPGWRAGGAGDLGGLLGPPGGVGGARGGEKGHALASGALRKPGRGDGGDGKEDQDACWAVAQGGTALGRAGAEEPDRGIQKIPNMQAHYQKTGKREVDLAS